MVKTEEEKKVVQEKNECATLRKPKEKLGFKVCAEYSLEFRV